MFPLWTTGAINSMMFGIYGNQMRFLQGRCETPRERENLQMRHVFYAGTAAGLAQSLLACPFELIKIKLQTHKCMHIASDSNPVASTLYSFQIPCTASRTRTDYRPAEARTIRSYVAYLIKRHGFLCMFRGLPLTIGRDVLPYGIYMYSYVNLLHMAKQFLVVSELNLDYTDDVRKQRIDAGRDAGSMWLTVLAGSLAGFCSWIVCIPFDVMKTKMQADDTYTSSWHCVRDNYQRHGWRSMFRGGYMVLMRAIPINAATFVGYEWSINKCNYILSE